MPESVTWHVEREAAIPPDIADAAARGVPIVAHVPRDARIDGRVAELLDECAQVVRYGT
ncbi:MAG TPA: hypothetical protein VF549_16175 [Solirubrobacteraceae bacterium]|jgi:hypothetical protein